MSLTVKNSNDLSYLFSGLNSQSSQSSNAGGLSSLISEYNSIKNGSYAKLAKQYYSSDTSGSKINPLSDKFSDAEDTVTNKTQQLTKESQIKQNKSLISDVASLRSSVSGIKNDDTLFTKSDTVGTDGATDYNYDKINSKLEAFVKNYNSVIENGSESENQTVLRNVLNMTKQSDNYKTQLEAAGITINDDNTLSFDKDTLKNSLNSSGSSNSLENTVKSLFSKTSNYMSQIDTLSTNVASQAASDVYSLGGYNSTGAYKQTLESIYNTSI